MLLPQDDALHFISLYTMLLYHAGHERGVLPADMTFDDFLDEPLRLKVECREAAYEPSPLFDEFLAANSDILSDEEKNKVSDWKRYVRGTFVVVRHLKKHSIFLDTESPPHAYGVLSLTSAAATRSCHTWSRVSNTVGATLSRV